MNVDVAVRSRMVGQVYYRLAYHGQVGLRHTSVFVQENTKLKTTVRSVQEWSYCSAGVPRAVVTQCAEVGQLPNVECQTGVLETSFVYVAMLHEVSEHQLVSIFDISEIQNSANLLIYSHKQIQ